MEINKNFSSKKIQVPTSQEKISCEGYQQSGHPRVFLDLSKQDITVCPYCSCQYIRNGNVIE